MTDKTQMTERIEEMLGSEGSRRLAEEMFPLLKADGYITFDAVEGFVMTPVPDDDDTWTSMIAMAETAVKRAMDFQVVGEPMVQPDESNEYETVMVINLKRQDGEIGDVWIIAGVPAHLQVSSDAARTQSGYQDVRVYGDSVDTWCPNNFQVPDDDGAHQTVREHVIDAVREPALAAHRAAYRALCADRF